MSIYEENEAVQKIRQPDQAAEFHTQVLARLDHQMGLLDQAVARQDRKWRPLRKFETGVVLAGGTLLTTGEPLTVPTGEEWRVAVAALSVGGASGAAVAALFVQDGSEGVSDSQLMAFAPALQGASPSRFVWDFAAPRTLYGGEGIVLQLSAAVVGAAVTLALHGLRATKN